MLDQFVNTSDNLLSSLPGPDRLNDLQPVSAGIGHNNLELSAELIIPILSQVKTFSVFSCGYGFALESSSCTWRKSHGFPERATAAVESFVHELLVHDQKCAETMEVVGVAFA